MRSDIDRRKKRKDKVYFPEKNYEEEIKELSETINWIEKYRKNPKYDKLYD